MVKKKLKKWFLKNYSANIFISLKGRHNTLCWKWIPTETNICQKRFDDLDCNNKFIFTIIVLTSGFVIPVLNLFLNTNSSSKLLKIYIYIYKYFNLMPTGFPLFEDRDSGNGINSKHFLRFRFQNWFFSVRIRFVIKMTMIL